MNPSFDKYEITGAAFGCDPYVCSRFSVYICGPGFIVQGREYVYESSATVKLTPLKTFINRGMGRHYAIKRIMDSHMIIDKRAVNKIIAAGRSSGK